MFAARQVCMSPLDSRNTLFPRTTIVEAQVLRTAVIEIQFSLADPWARQMFRRLPPPR